MVEDPELPFPESVAAAAIHKAGQRGAVSGKVSFLEHRRWRSGYSCSGALDCLPPTKIFSFPWAIWGTARFVLVRPAVHASCPQARPQWFRRPSVSPAYLGVGYIIGLRLAAIQFSGGVLAWGLMVPLLMFFLDRSSSNIFPPIRRITGPPSRQRYGDFIVRPIAVGGMLVGAAYTLYKMRTSLTAGLGRAFSDLRQTSEQQAKLVATERYMSSKAVFGLIALMFVLMCFLYIHYFRIGLARGIGSGSYVDRRILFRNRLRSLVGMIGSSNNPISGLTLSTLIIAALLMVSLGVSGISGVAARVGRSGGGLCFSRGCGRVTARILKSVTSWAALLEQFKSWN